MPYEYYFERLDVWKNSKEFVLNIYAISETFPKREAYGITSQIRRSAISIPSNIAEGLSRKTSKDRAKFISIAYSSTWETLNLLILLVDLEFISPEKYKELRSSLELICRQLTSLHQKVLSSPHSKN